MLSTKDIAAFRDDGYVVLRGAVAPAVVAAARHTINHDLGTRGMPTDELPGYRSRSAGNLLPVGDAQVALRFPVPPPEDTAWRARGHLDGVGNGLNGMERGQFSRVFTCLAVVMLSPLESPWNGNFTVWPGSHIAGETFFKQATPEVLRAGSPAYDLPRPPVQICGAPGDVVITHHQLWHGAAPNHGPDVARVSGGTGVGHGLSRRGRRIRCREDLIDNLGHPVVVLDAAQDVGSVAAHFARVAVHHGQVGAHGFR